MALADAVEAWENALHRHGVFDELSYADYRAAVEPAIAAISSSFDDLPVALCLIPPHTVAWVLIGLALEIDTARPPPPRRRPPPELAK